MQQMKNEVTAVVLTNQATSLRVLKNGRRFNILPAVHYLPWRSKT